MQSLSGLDAFFLYAETDAMHLHVALTCILDPRGAPQPLTLERLKALVAERLHLVPPFTHRLSEVPLGLDHPSWVTVDEVDLDYHVRGVTVPQPGGPEDLGRVCGAIASLPLDRRRPLWEMWLLDGLHDGNLALVAKIHHACIDGVSGAELITAFFDLDAEASVPIVPEPDPTPEGGEAEDDAAIPPSEAEMVTAALRARAETVRRIPALLGRTASGLRDVRRRRAERGESGGTPLTAPKLSFNRRLTPERNCAFAHVPLSEVKAIKDATRCTLNDVVLAVCAGALRRFLAARGELPDSPLVAVCPVSIRTQEERGQQNNRVSFLMTRLHTEIADPLQRLHAIRRAANAGKAEHGILGPTLLTDWTEALDPTLMRWGARLYLRSGVADHHPTTMNLIVSNVPGPPIPVYLAGAEVVRAYPMGPVMEDCGLNMTVMSYVDSLDFGLMVCDDAMPDVWDLADQVAPAFAELLAAVPTAVPVVAGTI